MYLSEIHRVYKEDPYFNLLDNFSFNAKNLYNNGLYHIRQYYIYHRNLKEGKSTINLNVSQELIDYMDGKGSYIDYYKLDYLCKKLENSLTEDYKSLPISSAS